MIRKLLRLIIHELRRIKQFFLLLLDFSIIDSYSLCYHKKEVSKDNFVYFKPKKWSDQVKLRNNFRDFRTLKDIFLFKYHLPPQGVNLTPNSIIVDLGCNIGLTIAHYKSIFPNILIIGYEMDYDNFLLAQKNTEQYHNVYLHNKAIWIHNDFVEYHKHFGYDGYSIHIKSVEEENTKVKGITLMDLIKQHQIEKIDFLKMDIEGAEKDVLNHRDLNWLDFVNALNIELHLVDDKAVQNYIKILENKGFKAWKDTKHVSSILAIKKAS